MRAALPQFIAALGLGLVALSCDDSRRLTPISAPAVTAPATLVSAGSLLRVQLPPAEAAPGPGILRVAVRVPEGFDVSGEAPSQLTLDAANRSVVDLSERELTWNSAVPEIGWPIPVTFAPGSTTLTASGIVYFCRADEAEVCRIQRIELVLPLTVSRSSATSDLELSYRLPHLSSP